MSMIGIQYLVDIFNVDASLMASVDWLYDHFRNSLAMGGMKIVGVGKRHTFPNIGSTFLFILQESHASLHSYPEHNYIAVDIFVCSDKDPQKAVDFFLKGLNRDINVNSKVLERGSTLREGES